MIKSERSMEAIRMKERLEAIRERALAQINETDSLDKLNDIRVAFLGKKGELTEVLKGMKEVAPEDRPKVGQIVNETRQAIEEVLDKAKTELAAKKRELQLKSEVIAAMMASYSSLHKALVSCSPSTMVSPSSKRIRSTPCSPIFSGL